MKQDRFLFGSISGMTGGIVALVFWALPAKLLGITDRIFYDWGMSLILFKPKFGVLDYTVGVLAHLGISGSLGIFFAGLIFLTSSRYLVIKGALFGVVVWYTLLGFGTLFRMPMFTVIPAKTALVTYVGSGIWGLTTSITLGFLHKKAVTGKMAQDKQVRRFYVAPVPAQKRHREGKTINPERKTANPVRPKKL